MGFYRGPKIVTDGLILALDAVNTKSYPGSGTNWYDLSGNNNHFTLFNNPTFVNNYFNFSGVNEYARSASTLDLSSYNSITIEIAFRVNTNVSPSGMTFEHSSNWNTQSMGFGLLPNSSGSTSYVSNSHHTNQYLGAGVLNYTGTIGTDIYIHTNIWSNINDTKGRIAYINGIERGSKATSIYPKFRNDYLYISSRGGTSIFANQQVFYIRLYGRKLSSNEVLQNYNSIKSRYSL